jgi:hypothetical protein
MAANLNQTVSGKPGAVHSAVFEIALDPAHLIGNMGEAEDRASHIPTYSDAQPVR